MLGREALAVHAVDDQGGVGAELDKRLPCRLAAVRRGRAREAGRVTSDATAGLPCHWSEKTCQAVVSSTAKRLSSLSCA